MALPTVIGFSATVRSAQAMEERVMMPRIDADTVPGHRARRERAIMDATFELLHETGDAPSLAKVAERAGLSRTAMYHYYSSAQELLRAAAREVYPRWLQRVTDAVESAPDPSQAVVAYAVACVDQVADGGHAVGTALASLDPEGPPDEQAQDMHASAREPLIGALKQLDVGDADAIANLVMSVIHGAGQMVESGVELPQVHRHLETMLGHLGSAPQSDR